MWYDTIDYTTIQMKYKTIHNPIQYNTIQCNTIQSYTNTNIILYKFKYKYNPIQHNTVQCKYNVIQMQ